MSVGVNRRSAFDTAQTAESDNIGAYVRAGSDGDLIASQTINSEEWLNVASVLFDDSGAVINAANPLPVDIQSSIDVTVDLDGFYVLATNPTPDSAGAIYHARVAAPDETSQIFRSTGGQPSVDNLAPTNVFALDVNSFNMGWDGSAWDRLTATSGSLDVNITGSTGHLDVSEEGYSSSLFAAFAATSTAAAIPASALTNRKKLLIQNLDNQDVYVGHSAAVTSSNGICIPAHGGTYEELLNASAPLFLISDGATADVRLAEYAYV